MSGGVLSINGDTPLLQPHTNMTRDHVTIITSPNTLFYLK